ncbi:MAG: hypothetical protein V3T55_08785, partial [Anaerolineales bacterium]
MLAQEENLVLEVNAAGLNIRSSQPEGHRIAHRADFQAFQAADALGAADIFRDPGNINRAFRFTAAAIRAVITIDNHSQRGDFVEHDQQCAQWAEIFTPETFHKHRCNDKG